MTISWIDECANVCYYRFYMDPKVLKTLCPAVLGVVSNTNCIDGTKDLFGPTVRGNNNALSLLRGY
jgi:hypothetical protein